MVNEADKMIDFAYARLNLRFNPFGELDRQQKIDNAIPRCDVESICEFLSERNASNGNFDHCEPAQDKRAVQFIGRPGSGKSTHLLMLASRLGNYAYVHIPQNCRRKIPARNFLMVDEAQRLTRRQGKHLLPQASRLIIGTHRCFDKRLVSQGFQVKTIGLDLNPDACWLANALQRKIESARREGGTEPPKISHSTVVKLIDEFGNNIRGMERKLYETLHQANASSTSVTSL